MRFKFVSIVLMIFSFIGLGIIGFSNVEGKLINVFSYLVVFILIPIYGAYSVWLKSRLGIIISLLFFATQSVRAIGGESWFPYSPPVSLGMPFGDFTNGTGYFIDFFAIAMVTLLLHLLLKIIAANKYSMVKSNL